MLLRPVAKRIGICVIGMLKKSVFLLVESILSRIFGSVFTRLSSTTISYSRLSGVPRR
jgi:hypothetical protein